MRRLILAAVTAATLAAAMVPASAAAAPVMQFGAGESGLELRSSCISGRGPASTTIAVLWKRASGVVKANLGVMSSPAGEWHHCSTTRALAIGDTIRAAAGPYARTFTMPNVSLVGERAFPGSFSGVGPVNSTGELWFRSGIFGDFYERYDAATNAQGMWAVPDAGAIGGIDAFVSWRTPQNDLLSAHVVVPYVDITIGRVPVEGGADALKQVVVDLRDPSTNALRGRLTAMTEEWGGFFGEAFELNGSSVTPRVGDRVVSNIASDLDWHVPNVQGTANVATDDVSGRCHSTEIEPIFAVIMLYRSGNALGRALPGLETDGTFAFDFQDPPGAFSDPANIRHNDRIVIHCYYETGDIVRRPFRVP